MLLLVPWIYASSQASETFLYLETVECTGSGFHVDVVPARVRRLENGGRAESDDGGRVQLDVREHLVQNDGPLAVHILHEARRKDTASRDRPVWDELLAPVVAERAHVDVVGHDFRERCGGFRRRRFDPDWHRNVVPQNSAGTGAGC